MPEGMLETRPFELTLGWPTTLLALVFLGLWVVIWAICLLGLRTAQNRYGGVSLPSRLDSLPSSSVPGVTIIRPLCGLDDNLYNTLEAVMKLSYPKFEVIFALQEDDDEALPVVRMIMEKFPDISARIIIDDTRVGVNPKVNNLMSAFAHARYDLLWVLDATISIQPGALGRMVDAFLGSPASTSAFDSDLESTPLMGDDIRKPPSAGQVGLVHHVPLAVVYRKTWGSLLEQAFLNTTHAKMYLAINATAIESCVMGKSNMYSRDNIASLTSPSPTLQRSPDPPKGLAGFGPFMAEDNMIALSLWHELGLKHAMTSDVALDFIGRLTVAGYIARRARWIRVRKKMTLPATIMEPFTESLLCGIYGSWAISRTIGASQPAIFLVHMLLWLVVDLRVKSSLETNVKAVGPSTCMLHFILAWCAREVLAMPIWLYAIFGDEVTWRGNRYRILGSGEAVRLA